MSVRHTAGAVFKAFTAHVTVFFVRMADFAPAVIRMTRNMMSVMMFMSAATFSMTMFVMVVFFPTTAAEIMVLMFFTAADIVLMPFMSMSFAAAARFVMAVLVFRLIAVLMPALVTVSMVMVTTATSPIFMMMVMRTHFIAAVSCIR